MNINYRRINLYQNWQAAHSDWYATRGEKRSFKEQFLLIQSPQIDLSNIHSCNSYFNQLKNGTRAISQDAENFANHFFSINRKNL